MGKFSYYLFYDHFYKIIEETLECELIRINDWMLHGKYHKNYIEYLVVSDLNESKLNLLEHIIKRKVKIINKNFTYKVRVYHQLLKKHYEFEEVKTKKLILGYCYDGLMSIPLTEQENNFLLVGASGSGKSCLAQSIIQNLINNHIEVWICDNKGSFDYDKFKLKQGKNIQDCLEMINQFENVVETRLSENKKHKPLLFVIDEIFPLSCCDSKLKKATMNKLALIMSRCRSANCHLMLISQRNTSDIIDTRLMANISIRICLQTSSKQESINAIDCDIAHKINTVGRGYVSINGILEEFQGFYLKGVIENGEIDEEGHGMLSISSENTTTSKWL